MSKLIYSTNMSLDGYIEDPQGKFDFSVPSEELHFFINDLLRTASLHLYGRRLYQTMMVWETDPSLASSSPAAKDFAGIWKAADKIVYSRTIDKASTTRTRIENNFDPETVRQLKSSTQEEMIIGGANLASHAFEAGLIDECLLFVVPVILGGGKSALPKNIRLPLELIEERKFDNGTVYARYLIRK